MIAQDEAKDNEFKDLQLLTVAEVADALGVSQRHVWALTAEGQFPRPVRFGRCSRWSTGDLELFLRVGADIDSFNTIKGAPR